MKTELKPWIIILFLVFCPFVLMAQENFNPLELTSLYYTGQLKNYKTFLLGGTLDQDFDPRKISKKAAISCEILDKSEKRQVIAVSVIEKDSQTDSYAFWVFENGWKLQAIRTLWLPGIFHIMHQKCKGMDDAGLKKLFEEYFDGNSEADSSISGLDIIDGTGSFDDFKLKIRIMDLTLASDKELVMHFEQNKEKFNLLLSKIKQNSLTVSERWRIDYQSEYKGFMQDLQITSVSNADHVQLISFVIGGMMDNFVGYFYCTDPLQIPVMEPNRFIMIRPLGNGWYLYKTT